MDSIILLRTSTNNTNNYNYCLNIYIYCTIKKSSFSILTRMYINFIHIHFSKSFKIIILVDLKLCVIYFVNFYDNN